MSEYVYVKEANSEVLVVLAKNYNSQLEAIQEAAKALQREALRLESSNHTPRYDRPRNGF